MSKIISVIVEDIDVDAIRIYKKLSYTPLWESIMLYILNKELFL